MSLILKDNDFINKTLLNTDSAVEFVATGSTYIDCGNPAKLSGITGAFSVSCNLMITGDNTDGVNTVNIFGQHDNQSANLINCGWSISYTNTNLLVQIYSGTSKVTAVRPISQNVLYNVVFTVEPSVYIKIYINGALVRTTTNTFSTINTPAYNTIIGASYTSGVISEYNNFILNNIAVYDKALTAFEIYHHIYLHNGEIRKPLHENIVYHLPLTQNFAHKAVAGDLSLTKGINIGDNVAFDISSRYNYCKTTVIEDAHAKFVNFNDDEIGTDSNQNISDSLRGFYENEEYRAIGKKYDYAIKDNDEIIGFSQFEYTQPVTFLVDIDLKSSGDIQNILNNRDGFTGFAIKSNSLYYFGSGSEVIRIIIGTVLDGRVIIIYTVDGSGLPSGMIAYENGIATGTAIGDAMTSTIKNSHSLYIGVNEYVHNRYANGLIHNIEILDSVKSLSDIQEASTKGTFHNVGSTLDSEFLLSVNFNKEDGQLNTKPNTPVYAIQAYEDTTAVTPVLGDGTYLESKTNLPKISESLLIEGTKYVEYPTHNLPTDTEDFTLMVSGWITDANPSPLGTDWHQEALLILADKNSGTYYGDPTAGGVTRLLFEYQVKSAAVLRNKYLLTQYRTPSNYYYNSEEYQYKYFCQLVIVIKGDIFSTYANGQLVSSQTLATKINPSIFVTKLFRSGYQNWDSSPTVLSNISQMYLSQMEYWKRALEGWEVATLYNNSQLANPFAYNTTQLDGFQDKLEQYFQFQKGAIYKHTDNEYYCKNQADVMAGTWTAGQINDAHMSSADWTDAELIGSTPTKIILNNSIK